MLSERQQGTMGSSCVFVFVFVIMVVILTGRGGESVFKSLSWAGRVGLCACERGLEDGSALVEMEGACSEISP
jgi:hypothetical protein